MPKFTEVTSGATLCLCATALAVAVLALSSREFFGGPVRAESQATTHTAPSGGDYAPDFMQKGVHLRGWTENTAGSEVIVRDVQRNWVLVEVVLPKEAAQMKPPSPLRWINLSTEKGFWSPLDPGPVEPK